MTVIERRKLRFGFRSRVLGLCAVLLVGAAGLGLVVQRGVLLNRLDNEVTRSLDQERREMEILATGSDPSTGEPFAGDIASIFDTFLGRNETGEGEVFLTFVGDDAYKSTPAPQGIRLDAEPALVERWTSLQVGERGRLNTAAGPVVYLAVPLLDEGRTAGVFVAANFVRNERDQIEETVVVEAIVSSVVVLLAVGAAWLLAGRLLQPIRRVTEAARSISETDLARRIVVETDDEIGELAVTFNDMLQRLDSAFAAQRAFIDDAGHELRTPITIVRGHLELMGDDPQERQETIALVTDELDRMARIVNDLLLLAKAEQPDFVDPRSVEMNDFTTELLMKATALGDREWRLDDCADAIISADSDRLNQAMLNLARNAVEHTGSGDEIGIGSACRDGTVRLWVRDTGPGIDPSEHAQVFDRFNRGRNRPRRSDGAGLGLAIVRAVADGHDATIEIESDPPNGATFTIVLPHSGDAEAGATDDARASIELHEGSTHTP